MGGGVWTRLDHSIPWPPRTKDLGLGGAAATCCVPEKGCLWGGVGLGELAIGIFTFTVCHPVLWALGPGREEAFTPQGLGVYLPTFRCLHTTAPHEARLVGSRTGRGCLLGQGWLWDPAMLSGSSAVWLFLLKGVLMEAGPQHPHLPSLQKDPPSPGLNNGRQGASPKGQGSLPSPGLGRGQAVAEEEGGGAEWVVCPRLP